MRVDWFTVAAQAINFLVLVWLMKRFLYQPILDAIDAREGKIAAELADADAKRAEARRDRDDLQRRGEAFDQQRAGLLAIATAEADALRQRLLDEAHQAADGWRAGQQQALRTEASSLHETIARRTQEEVFAITRRVLTDLAATSLEDRMVEVFIVRLAAMELPERETLARAVQAPPGPVIVRSAFELPAKQRAALRKAIHETLAADPPLRFEIAPAVVSGIELTAHGQKVAWSMADYLASLERGVADLLRSREQPSATSGAKPVGAGEAASGAVPLPP